MKIVGQVILSVWDFFIRWDDNFLVWAITNDPFPVNYPKNKKDPIKAQLEKTNKQKKLFF